MQKQRGEGGKAWCILSCEWCHCPPTSRWTEKRKGPNCLAVSVQGVGALNICKVKIYFSILGTKTLTKFFSWLGTPPQPNPGRQWCHSHQKCLSYRVVGCLLFRGCLSKWKNSQKCPLYQSVCSWDCWVLVKQDICCLPVWYRWCRMMKEVGKHLQDFVLHTFDTPRVERTWIISVWAGTTCHHSSNCFSQLDNIPAGLTGHLKLKLYLQSQKSSWQYFQSSCSVCASWRAWHLLHEDCTTVSFM